MYDIALSVTACLRAGTKVDVAWIVATDDFPDRDEADAIAITPGGGRIGSLLSGALVEVPVGNRLVDVTVTDVDALVAGLTHGGTARVVTIHADDPLPVCGIGCSAGNRSASSSSSTPATSWEPSCSNLRLPARR